MSVFARLETGCVYRCVRESKWFRIRFLGETFQPEITLSWSVSGMVVSGLALFLTALITS